MSIQQSYNEYTIAICDEPLYNPNSADNSTNYIHIYQDNFYKDHLYLTRHGITIYHEKEVISSALVVSSGGTTGIQSTCSVLKQDRLLICCANSIFCLALPNLALVWRVKADDATCFAIHEHKDGFIIHGELAISKIDINGSLLWQFTSSDIFTTPTGRDVFKISNNIVFAKNWDEVLFELDANTGTLIKQDTTNAIYS